MAFTKLFSQIVTSTIWQEDHPTRILWITMLALADAYGCVYGSIPGLAKQAQITLEECERALEKFQQPDKYSSSPEDEGRRIRKIERGWKLVNYDTYKYTMSADEIREKTRQRVARFRERKQNERLTNNVTPSVTQCNERNAGNDTRQDKTRQDNKIKISPSKPSPPAEEEIFQLYPRKVGKRAALKAIQSAIKRVQNGEYKNEPKTHQQAIDAIRNRVSIFAQSEAGNRGQYTPHPATWFNRSSYLDDPKGWNSQSGNGQDGGNGASKAQRRLQSNREAILVGLGYSEQAG